jgi:hypothetical protein
VSGTIGALPRLLSRFFTAFDHATALPLFAGVLEPSLALRL